MTLKNEFLTAHSISGGIGMNEKQAVQCGIIADEYAIRFAEYIIRHPLNILRDGIYWNYILEKEITTKELLKKFKKEKVL
jgi:hypothetical protein